MKRAAKREHHEATGVAIVAAVTVRNGLRGALSGAESQRAAGELASELPGFHLPSNLPGVGQYYSPSLKHENYLFCKGSHS